MDILLDEAHASICKFDTHRWSTAIVAIQTLSWRLDYPERGEDEEEEEKETEAVAGHYNKANMKRVSFNTAYGVLDMRAAIY